MTPTIFVSKTLLFSFVIFIISSCEATKENQSSSFLTEEEPNLFAGTWLLDHVTWEDSTGTIEMVDVFSKALLMYSDDGYMSAILTYSEDYGDSPGLDVGYCGRYKLNTEDSSVSHFRDMIVINADSENVVYVRDYSFSDDKKLLTLSPREDIRKGMSLTWRRVE